MRAAALDGADLNATASRAIRTYAVIQNMQRGVPGRHGLAAIDGMDTGTDQG